MGGGPGEVLDVDAVVLWNGAELPNGSQKGAFDFEVEKGLWVGGGLGWGKHTPGGGGH